MKKSYVIIDREAGNIIEYFTNKENAEKALEIFELWDKNEGVYTPNFYEIKEVTE